MGKFTAIRDSREQSGYWTFRLSEHCTGTEVKGLKTGDYTLCGFEDKLCIERKGCIAEFAANLMQARFDRELQRMEEFPHAFILLEFTLDDLLGYPRTANIPARIKNKIKIRGSFLLKKLIELELKYKVKVIFCGNEGQKVALQIFKEIYSKYGKNGEA